MKLTFRKTLCLPVIVLLATGCHKHDHETQPQVPFVNAYSLKSQKAYGGNNAEGAWAIAATADGGTVAVGYTDGIDGDVSANHGATDIWVFKLNESGSIVWQKSIGGTDDEQGTGVAVASNGDVIVVGHGYSIDEDMVNHHGDDNSDIVVTRLNANGELQWRKMIGGTAEDYAGAVTTVSDGILIAGTTNSTDGNVTGHIGDYDAWVVKLDNNGTLQWQKVLGGSDDDGMMSIVAAPDGSIGVCGYSFSSDGNVTANHGDYDMWVAKLNASGSLNWQKSIGGSDYESGAGITLTADNGFAVVADSESEDADATGNHGSDDILVAKLDANGNLQWKKMLGGSDAEFSSAIVQTPDQGLVLTGASLSSDGNLTNNHGQYDLWVVKLDNNGNLKWQKNYGGSSWDVSTDIVALQNGELRIAGTTYSDNGDVTGYHGGDGDAWIVRLQP